MQEKEIFESVYKQIVGITVIGKERLETLWEHVQYANSIEDGFFAEVGVYRGGSARLISRGANNIVYLFDTFSGMPIEDPTIDKHKQGEFKTSLEFVQSYLSDCDNIKIYPGLFPTSGKNIEKLKFKFVHVDVDLYKSVLDCCEFFYPKLVSGGIMIFDDYEWHACPGVKKAMQEYFSAFPKQNIVVPSELSQCYLIKQ